MGLKFLIFIINLLSYFLILSLSIGSLGKDNSTGMVTKVVLDTAFIRETTNGVRIKTWQVILEDMVITVFIQYLRNV